MKRKTKQQGEKKSPQLEAGENFNKPVKKVRHAKLKRLSVSGLASMCPVCKEGILPMRRQMSNGRLRQDDICLLCGQQFTYLDVDSKGHLGGVLR